ncbi:oxidoreductase [Devosia limi DSM 17137]|uniref:Oxidoreductase n=1 Tax=Devosia limi DSM 17137 TaxID=1121477 RepID=A0A0F5LU37_9HYPH|nr:Gfo/Idh/MocA family oxidoreductase [Devosia limi]KKB85162.1 oxidoreductase [Devosia limi DSM 17137]SHF76924.1 Predicted dehydrogenase [Devosia limi DSM 17137]
MTKKLGIAVIGLGMASQPHARALLALGDSIETLHAFSPSAARRQSFAQAYGLPVIDNAEAIFGDPRVDAVLVLTPPNTHLELVQQAAAAGKHVLLEKPLDISIARAEQLVEVAERAGITLGVVLQNRFRPAALALQALLDSGRLGRLVQVAARTSYWRPQSYYDEPGRGTLARDGGGVLLTQAIHNLDLMIALAGLPQTVSGFVTTSPVHAMEGEDVATAALRFANGALGTVSATTCAFPGLPDAIELVGDKGTAQLNGTTLTARLHDGTQVDVDGDEAGSGSGADPMGFSSQAHQALIVDFAAALAEGRQPRISGRDALQVHYLIAAMLGSRGHPVQL